MTNPHTVPRAELDILAQHYGISPERLVLFWSAMTELAEADPTVPERFRALLADLDRVASSITLTIDQAAVLHLALEDLRISPRGLLILDRAAKTPSPTTVRAPTAKVGLPAAFVHEPTGITLFEGEGGALFARSGLTPPLLHIGSFWTNLDDSEECPGYRRLQHLSYGSLRDAIESTPSP